MRQRGHFAGFSLYVSNTTDRHMGHLCYKDGPQLPPLDFNTNCLTHGRYVIFYNERLPGTTYPMGYELAPVFTQLCEVTVTEKTVIKSVQTTVRNADVTSLMEPVQAAHLAG